jgi:group I intron endonuclease
MLGILEYYPIDKLTEQEQFYINTLFPEYNILKHAYTSYGYKHTSESLLKMNQPRPN